MNDLTSMKYFFHEGKSPSSQDFKGWMLLKEGPRTKYKAQDLQPKWHLLIQMPGASQVTGQATSRPYDITVAFREWGPFWEMRL